MPAKVKGFLKGLISQILEPNSKEPEMQIGHPTDVKHVAHIGWDGPSVTPPTWMSDFKTGPDFSTAPLSSKENRSSSRRSSHGVTSRKQSRRKQMPGDSSLDSVPNNSSVQSTNNYNDILSREEPFEVSSHLIVQKERRRKKSKESSIGGSVRSKSRITTASCSDTECTSTSTKMRSLHGSKRVALQEV